MLIIFLNLWNFIRNQTFPLTERRWFYPGTRLCLKKCTKGHFFCSSTSQAGKSPYDLLCDSGEIFPYEFIQRYLPLPFTLTMSRYWPITLRVKCSVRTRLSCSCKLIDTLCNQFLEPPSTGQWAQSFLLMDAKSCPWRDSSSQITSPRITDPTREPFWTKDSCTHIWINWYIKNKLIIFWQCNE
jgi:hypothetical protein